MQEIIDLSDSNDDFSEANNVNKPTHHFDDSIEIIDLSITEHTKSRSIIVSEIIEDSEVYPSSPTNSRPKLLHNTAVALKFDNNNSLEISAPLIHDDTSINSTVPSVDISIKSHTKSSIHINKKEQRRGLLDDIIDYDSFSDRSLDDIDAFDKPLNIRDIASRRGPEKSSPKPITTRNIGGATSITPSEISTSLHSNIIESPPTQNIIESPQQQNVIQSPPKPIYELSQERIIELPQRQLNVSPPSNIFESPSPEINQLQPQKLVKSVSRTDSIIKSKPLNDSNLDYELYNKTTATKISNQAMKETIIKPYISANSNIHNNKRKSEVTTNIRVKKIMSKGKRLEEDVELDLPMFLEESDGEFDLEVSSPLKKKQKRSKTTSSITTSDIVLPMARSKTAGDAYSLHNEHSINESRNLKSEYARLSTYIVNGKSFTDEESRETIAKSLKDDKEAFKRVNQVCKDNQEVRKQIIIEFSDSLIKLLEKTQHDYTTLLEPVTIQTSYSEDLPMIRFLRRVDSVYDFNHDYYYPCENQIIEENEILLYYDAKTFFQQYSKNKRTLYKSIGKIRKRNKYVILVLYDLKKLKKTIELIEDHRFKERVNERLSGSQSTSPSKSGSKVKKTNMQEVSDLGMKVFDIEQRIRFIDREWKIKVHTVNSHVEFLHSLPNLISLIAKKRMDSALRFMKYAHINVRSGTDKTDILKKTLREIGRVPELKSRGISKQYPDLQCLFQDFSNGQLQSGMDGRHLLSEKMEKRLHKLFTCQDPNEVIE